MGLGTSVIKSDISRPDPEASWGGNPETNSLMGIILLEKNLLFNQLVLPKNQSPNLIH
jgi:hypothetical protein